METYKLQVALLALLVMAFIFPLSQITSGQELSGGAKLVGTTPFLFTEAKFWILAAEVGVGLSNSDTAPSEYEESSIDFSLTGKAYPIQFNTLSPYLGFSSIFSSNGYFKQSRTFGGVEFDFSEGGIPFSVFGGADYITKVGEGSAGFGWHLGVKYSFLF